MKYKESELSKAAKRALQQGKGHSVWCFLGEMGSGKTTFIKAICKELGVHDSMSSPTFSIVNQYLSDSGKTIYHFDFYRVESVEDALRIGVDEYLDSGELCLIEWPLILEELLPEQYLEININFVKENIREITLGTHG